MISEPNYNGKVLFIAFFFPPLGGAGVQRSVKFTKYLPQFGWLPIVLTSNAEDYQSWDKTFFQEIPDFIKIVRTNIWETTQAYEYLLALRFGKLRKWLRRVENDFLIPDKRVGWFPFAYHAGLRAIQAEAIDIIFTTSAPYTAHLIGWALKRKTGKPWVADFRDEWSELPHVRWRGLRKKTVSLIERSVLRNADVVTSTSDKIGSLLAGKTSCKEKFQTITNGYDEEDFNKAASNSVFSPKGEFVVTYTGSLFPPQSPNSFLQAVVRLMKRDDGFRSETIIRFIGAGLQDSMISSLGLDKMVYNSRRAIPHVESIKEQLSATVLLLIHSTRRGEYVVPGKIFEYLRSGKPILALVPPNSVAGAMIREIGAGVVVDPEDVEQIREALSGYYRKWKAGTLSTHSKWDLVSQYSRERTTRRLAEIFDSLQNKQNKNSAVGSMHKRDAF